MFPPSHSKRWKPEIRILGVEAAATCKGRQLCICVVSRGPLLIDGTFALLWNMGDADSLAQGIKSSPFYKELAAVLFSSSLPLMGRLNEVAVILKKPALLVTRLSGSIVECSGMSSERAASLIKTLRGPLGIEALRIALLLAPLVKSLHEDWKSLNQPYGKERDYHGVLQ
ncbi:MAG: hypothetical protein N3H31_01305 [Candidatus Nezhaarchaeota archaeon]|nr:hypothetical protein [Candidatus Nezhaarchaeota archaeon]